MSKFTINLPERNHRRSGLVRAIHMRHGNASVVVPSEKRKRQSNRSRRKVALKKELDG